MLVALQIVLDLPVLRLTTLRQLSRTAVRWTLRPLWLIVWRRVEARIRTMGTSAGVPISHEAAWQQHMPAFLNAVSTVGAFGHELLRHKRETEASIADLRRRLDVVEDMNVQADRDHVVGKEPPAPEMVAASEEFDLLCIWRRLSPVEQRDLLKMIRAVEWKAPLAGADQR
jgi:hypothetical protein